MDLSVIILSYNTKELTIQCIRSLSKQYKKELEEDKFEIIIFDNASTDDSAKVLKELIKNKKNVILLQNDENLGFTKGNNKAAQIAKGKYLLFLNSDTEVTDRELLNMIEFLSKHKNIGIMGAKMKNIDGAIQSSAGVFYTVWNSFILLFLGERLGFGRFSPNRISEVDWVSGASLMIRRQLFYKLDGFDKNIFMYVEDMDLCYRAKKNGDKTFFYSDITILHKGQGSSDRSFAVINIYKGLLYFFRKHKSYTEYLFIKLILNIKAALAILIGIITNNTYLKETYRSAIRYSL